jgi:retinol dehydrogenase-12
VRSDPCFSTPPLAPGALHQRTVVITGASDGIGRALAATCAAAGARVVMVGRNEAKTRHAASVIRSRTGNEAVSVEIADLLRLDEQAELAARLAAAHPVLHALVNNAGALFLERALTADGLERTFALNHLAPVQLGVRLLPALLAAAGPGGPARLVTMSSRAHRRARLDLDDLQGARRWSGWGAYAASKLGNVLFTRALAARVDARRLCVHAVHPGVVASRFAVNNGRAGRWQRRVMDWFSISNEAGADTAAWLLASEAGGRDTGRYWIRRERVEPSRAARDAALAEALWARSLALAGLDEPVTA